MNVASLKEAKKRQKRGSDNRLQQNTRMFPSLENHSPYDIVLHVHLKVAKVVEPPWPSLSFMNLLIPISPRWWEITWD